VLSKDILIGFERSFPLQSGHLSLGVSHEDFQTHPAWTWGWFCFALILILPLSIVVDSLAGKIRIDELTNTTIPGVDGAPDVRAYVAAPEGEGPFPTVIMIHEFYGLNESITSKADLLAQEGYLVIAPDTFRGQTTPLIPRAIYLVSTTDQEDVYADLNSVYAWLESQPNVDAARIGIAGFCYGGRVSLLYSLRNSRLAATVVFYGSSETDPEC
jgi:carboxymethylenebutenolidase